MIPSFVSGLEATIFDALSRLLKHEVSLRHDRTINNVCVCVCVCVCIYIYIHIVSARFEERHTVNGIVDFLNSDYTFHESKLQATSVRTVDLITQLMSL